jgi:hypothetical protein
LLELPPLLTNPKFMNGIEKMTAKDVSVSLNVSPKVAAKILITIKKDFDLRIVTYWHFKKFLKLEDC